MSVPTNFSTIMFLFNPKLRAIACSYDPDEKVSIGFDSKVKTKLFKTLDPAIKVGDFVVVPTGTRHKMTINRVEEVDCEVDPESPLKMDWIVGTVDRKPYEDTLSREGDAIAAIKQAEAAKKREDLMKNLQDHYGPAIKNLSLAPPRKNDF